MPTWCIVTLPSINDTAFEKLAFEAEVDGIRNVCEGRIEIEVHKVTEHTGFSRIMNNKFQAIIIIGHGEDNDGITLNHVDSGQNLSMGSCSEFLVGLDTEFIIINACESENLGLNVWQKRNYLAKKDLKGILCWSTKCSMYGAGIFCTIFCSRLVNGMIQHDHANVTPQSLIDAYEYAIVQISKTKYNRASDILTTSRLWRDSAGCENDCYLVGPTEPGKIRMLGEPVLLPFKSQAIDMEMTMRLQFKLLDTSVEIIKRMWTCLEKLYLVQQPTESLQVHDNKVMETVYMFGEMFGYIFLIYERAPVLYMNKNTQQILEAFEAGDGDLRITREEIRMIGEKMFQFRSIVKFIYFKERMWVDIKNAWLKMDEGEINPSSLTCDDDRIFGPLLSYVNTFTKLPETENIVYQRAFHIRLRNIMIGAIRAIDPLLLGVAVLQELPEASS